MILRGSYVSTAKQPQSVRIQYCPLRYFSLSGLLFQTVDIALGLLLLRTCQKDLPGSFLTPNESFCISFLTPSPLHKAYSSVAYVIVGENTWQEECEK